MTLEYRTFSFTPYGENWTRRHYAPDPFGDVRERSPAEALVGDKLIGHAIVYNSDSHDLGGFIERVDAGALTRSLDAAAAGGLNIFAFWSHDSSQPLGSTRGGKLKLASDADGLAFELDTSRFTPAQLDAARENELRMSFGFRVVKDSWVYRDDGIAERTLLDVDLFEVSPVVSPAYPDTTAALGWLETWKTDERKASANAEAVRNAQCDPKDAVADPTKAATYYGVATKEQTKENIALIIKRNLMLKAIEQHIARTPQA